MESRKTDEDVSISHAEKVEAEKKEFNGIFDEVVEYGKLLIVVIKFNNLVCCLILGVSGLSGRQKRLFAGEKLEELGIKEIRNKHILPYKYYHGLQKSRKEWKKKRDERRKQTGIVTHHLMADQKNKKREMRNRGKKKKKKS